MMMPTNEVELAEIVAGAEGPLAVQGGGTRGQGAEGAALRLAQLNGITLYEPGALTLVARAGTPLAEIEVALAAEKQRLAFEPMDHRGLLGTQGVPTIGGVVAANVSGPRRIQVGACRDFLLGVRFVDGRGQVIKNGGRVMKNVTGYDLVKLMAGSWGTLGVLSEVSLKVLPLPDAQATVLVQVSDVAQAVRAMSAALGSPFDITGAAFDPAQAHVMVRIEGFAESVSYRAGRLRDVLSAFGEVSIVDDPTNSAQMWRAMRDVEAFQGRDGDVWRLSVVPSQAPGIAARLSADGLLYDWGGGLIWALVPAGTDLRKRFGAIDGHATLVRASSDTQSALGRFQAEPAPLAALSAGIRAQFDPRGILNRGLMHSPAEG